MSVRYRAAINPAASLVEDTPPLIEKKKTRRMTIGDLQA
jgi:hypothetical protein